MGEVSWDRWEQFLTWIFGLPCKLLARLLCLPFVLSLAHSLSSLFLANSKWGDQYACHVPFIAVHSHCQTWLWLQTRGCKSRCSQWFSKFMLRVVPTCPKVLHPLQWRFIHQTKCHNHGYWRFEGFLILSTWAGAMACESCNSNFWTPCSSKLLVP